MIKNTWVVIAGIIAGFSLFMATVNTAIASSDLLGSNTNDVKQIDGRERTRVAGPGHSFSFVGWNVCNEDTEICVSIWGSGYFNTDRDQITARGSLTKSMDNVAVSRGSWYALDLINGSDRDATFKARASVGVINIMIDEGFKTDPTKVCVYGDLVGITNQSDAICTEDARVSIS